MRPKKHSTSGESDLFRARLDQIINMKNELVQLAGKVDWDWLDREIAPLYSDKGRPGIETRFVIGLLLLIFPEEFRSPATRPASRLPSKKEGDRYYERCTTFDPRYTPLLIPMSVTNPVEISRMT